MKKFKKLIFIFLMPAIVAIITGAFSLSSISQTAHALSGNGGAIYVGANSTYNYNRGSISLSKASGNGGGVYVDAGGTFNMSGGLIYGNTASGNGNQIYNNGNFTMTGGTVGEENVSTTGYGIYNTATMKLNGGNVYDNVYSVNSFNTNVSCNIKGSITLGENAIVKVNGYTTATPSYSFVVPGQRNTNVLVNFGTSDTKPDGSKINVKNSSGKALSTYVFKNDSGEWVLELVGNSGGDYGSLKVSFNAGGGEVSSSEKDIIYNAEYGELPTSTKHGYIFKGWSLNYVDVEQNVFGFSDCTRDGTTFTYDTGSTNTNEGSACFQVQTYKDTSTVVDGLFSTWSLGVVSFTFTKNDSFNYLRVKLNGNNRDAVLFINATGLTNGETYVFQANIQEISMNHMVVKDIKIEKNSRNIATTFNDDTVTESTIVKVPTNHTLFARWTERKVTIRANNGDGDSTYLGDVNDVISIGTPSNPNDMKVAGLQGESAYIGANDQVQSTWYSLGSKYKFEDLITVNCWVYLNNWTTFTRAISCTDGGGWNFEKADSNGKSVIQFSAFNKGIGYLVTDGVELSTISAGWHMLTGTFDGKNTRFYIDGVLRGMSETFTSGKIGYNATNSIIVGAEAGSGENEIESWIPVLPGKIRNVAIYNSAFSGHYVEKLYVNGHDSTAEFLYGFSNREEDVLEVQWASSVYDVKFNPTNGSAVTTGKVKLGISYNTFLPAAPTKNNYKFVGWSKNYFNHDKAIMSDSNCIRNGTTFTFDSGSSNTNESSARFAVQTFSGLTYVSDIFETGNVGLAACVFTKNSSYSHIRLKLNGNNVDTYFFIDVTGLVDGEQYVLQANILELSLNHMVVKDVMIEQNEKSFSTDYTCETITSSTVCDESCGHTLFAWWQDKTANVIVKNLSGGRYEGSVMGNASGIWSGTYKVGDTLTISYSPNGLYSFSKVVKGTNWNGATIHEGSVSNINYTITEEDCDNGTIDFRICYTISGTLHSVTNGVVDDATGGTVRLYSYQTPAGLVTNGWAYYGPNTSKEIYATAIGDYTFKGWFKNSDCTGTPVSTNAEYNFTDGTTGDYEYWALFTNYRDFPSTWKTEIASTTYMTTTVTPENLTSIKFVATIPSGYTKIGTLSTGLSVYKGTTATEIAFVASRIFAPVNSSSLFSSLTNLLNIDFSTFDTSNVTYMYNMFYNCSRLTSLDLSNFNTSNVTSMARMFMDCSKLTSLNISGFNTSKVTSMDSMFYNCSSLTNLNLSNFNTSNVTNMRYIFYGCSSLTSLDLSNFNTSNVTGMYSMFAGCKNLTSLDLSKFNTSKVTHMNFMFNLCESLTSLDLSNFDTSNVVRMESMFSNCSALTNLDLSNFDTSNVTVMSYMFNCCSSLTSLDLSNFNTSKVTDMGLMFSNCKTLTSLDLSMFNMANVTKVTNMLNFGSSNKIEVLKTPYNNTMDLAITTGSTLYNEDTGAVVTSVPANTTKSLTYVNENPIKTFPTTWKTEVASSTYMTTTVTPANLTSIKFVASVPSGYSQIGTLSTGLPVYKGTTATDIAFVGKKIYAPVNSSYLFYNLSKLTTLDMSVFDTSKVTGMSSMFNTCSALTSLDVSGFNTSNVTGMRSMFNRCSALKSLGVSNFDTSKVTDMSVMFNNCSALTSLDLSNFNTSNVTDMSSMFDHCSALTSLDLSNFNTTKVTDMTSMFSNCSALTSINVSNFDTSKVTDMRFMFNECSALTSLNVSRFNTSNVTNMFEMFYKCKTLTSLDVSGFNTSKVTNMSSMFNTCSALTSLDVSGFNTSNVTDMSYMFWNCSALTSLDVSGFNTSKVTNMSSMFYNCSALISLDVGGFSTSKVTNMYNMFGDCSALTSLDLSNFNTSNVTDMSSMFRDCSALTSLNLSSFNMAKVTSSSNMLYFGSTNKIHLLKTPYNNTSAIAITTGSTLYKRETSTVVTSVPVHSTSSMTYIAADSVHSFKTSTYYTQIAKNRAKHNVSTTKTCTVCYYSTTTETTEAHSFLSTGSCSKCGFSIGTQYILKNNYDDGRDIDIIFEKDKQRKEFFVLKVAG